MLKLILGIVFSFFSIEKIFSQNKHTPARLEEKTSLKEVRNSKLGDHTVKKKYFELIYKDSTHEILTENRLEVIIQTVPEAQMAWKKYKANNLYKISSLPFLAMGFVKGVSFLNNKEHRKVDAAIGVLGLAGAVAVFNYFDHKAVINKKKMLLYYNRHWSTDFQKRNFDDIITPDNIRIGFVQNANLGIGFTWFLDK